MANPISSGYDAINKAIKSKPKRRKPVPDAATRAKHQAEYDKMSARARASDKGLVRNKRTISASNLATKLRSRGKGSIADAAAKNWSRAAAWGSSIAPGRTSAPPKKSAPKTGQGRAANIRSRNPGMTLKRAKAIAKTR